MKFAVEWTRPKLKGYESKQRAVFFNDNDVLWYIEMLRKDGMRDIEVMPVLD